jgi:flagellin-like protein
MSKRLKSRKALSPVIATIILVAVTVAVSIAVAAWMGALTFSFTKTDQFQVNSVVFISTSPYTGINMSIQNTGSSSWTVTSTAQINSATNVPVTVTGTGATSLTCAAGKTIYIKLTYTCTSGNQYTITLLLSDGNKISYVSVAP